MAFEIRNESDLFEALDRLRSVEALEELRFIGWPRLEVTIRGEDFDGGVPTRVMPSLLEFQATINRAYARAVGRRLNREERRQAELIVRLRPGSTTFESELAPALNNALVAAIKNMSGTQSLVAILAVAAVAGSVWAWKAYLGYRAKRLEHDVRARELQYHTRLSEEETRRAEILAGIARDNPLASSSLENMSAARDKMLLNLQDDDELVVGGEHLVKGDMARRIARKPRPGRVHDRLDADFIILSVESGRIRSGYRVRVRAVGSGDELTVSIPAGTLPPNQIADLQSGEWGKAPLRMQINIVRAGGRVVEATLISAGLSRGGDQ